MEEFELGVALTIGSLFGFLCYKSAQKFMENTDKF